MHLNASPQIFRNAAHLRENPTPAEEKLWEHLRERQMEGEKFRRQHPFKRYAGDLYCYKLRLVVEVDGGYHDHPSQKFYDDDRTENLEFEGLSIIRFSNREVMNSLETVLEAIKTKVHELQENRKATRKKPNI
jgi:very-short-patch-repair endonuclease